jgi:hypothetical protein
VLGLDRRRQLRAVTVSRTALGASATAPHSGIRTMPRQQIAARVVEHPEQAGFEIDEAEQVMRKRPPTRGHG